MDLLAELEAAFNEGSPEPPPAAAEAPPKHQRLAQPSAEHATSDDVHAGATEPPHKRQRLAQPSAEHATSDVHAGAAAGAHSRSAGPPPACAAAVAPPSSCPLLCLPDFLLLRLLAKTSPDDLLALSQASRQLRAAASDAALWRSLYHARWPDGPQQEDAEHAQGCSWKILYCERDHQAALEAQRSAPNQAMLPIYLQMATARRSEPLSAAAAEGLYASPRAARGAALSSKVDAFRRRHGLTDAGKHAAHSCLGGCTWDQLEHNAWICEKSGFVHVCDAECAFREPDPSSDLQVCTISGRCFAHMLTEREEHAGEWERGQSRGQREQEEEGWGAEEGMGGRLGKAFYLGYTADTPNDFYRRFGVRF